MDGAAVKAAAVRLFGSLSAVAHWENQIGLAAGAVRRGKPELFDPLEGSKTEVHRRLSKFIHDKLGCSEEVIVSFWTSVTVRRPDRAPEKLPCFEGCTHKFNGRKTISLCSPEVWSCLVAEPQSVDGDELHGWGVWRG